MANKRKTMKKKSTGGGLAQWLGSFFSKQTSTSQEKSSLVSTNANDTSSLNANNHIGGKRKSYKRQRKNKSQQNR